MFDPVPNVDRQDVLRIVRRDFSAADQEQALAVLEKYRGTPEPFRVHMAALKLSGGNLDKLREAIDAANVDFRDVLAPAEYPKFWELGFVGIEELTASQQRQLKEDDWRQYQTWLSQTEAQGD